MHENENPHFPPGTPTTTQTPLYQELIAMPDDEPIPVQLLWPRIARELNPA